MPIGIAITRNPKRAGNSTVGIAPNTTDKTTKTIINPMQESSFKISPQINNLYNVYLYDYL